MYASGMSSEPRKKSRLRDAWRTFREDWVSYVLMGFILLILAAGAGLVCGGIVSAVLGR